MLACRLGRGGHPWPECSALRALPV